MQAIIYSTDASGNQMLGGRMTLKWMVKPVVIEEEKKSSASSIR
jgi:hypothetical protein